MKILSERKAKILEAVIREYTRTAAPVASGRLHERFGVSPATIRSILAELEEGGYLTHPHTSAGRIPTEAGYRYFITHFIPADCRHEDTAQFRKIEHEKDVASFSKGIAKVLAEITGEAAFVSFGPRLAYYTGLSQLLKQPEFQESKQVMHMSEVLDRFDEVIGEITDQVAREVQVFVGHENPFGADCSAIVVRIRGSQEEMVLGLLGPMRMDYKRNICALHQAHDLLEQELQ